jgi:hypothetical protein
MSRRLPPEVLAAQPARYSLEIVELLVGGPFRASALAVAVRGFVTRIVLRVARGAAASFARLLR